MAVLSDSFGGIDVVKDANGIMRRYDNQGPTDDTSVLVLSKSTISDLIELTFNHVQTRTEDRTFIALQPGTAEVAAVGQAEFTTAGSSSWVVPAGVTSISVVVIGGGGGGVYSTSGGSGGAGGNLRYSTSISVTPGETLTIIRGIGGAISTTAAGAGGASSIVRASNSTTLISAAGGGGGRVTNTPNVQNGTSTAIGGTIGGGTGGRATTATTTTSASGGGGAAGYSGNGGNAGTGAVAGTAGAGGGGGGGGGGGSGGTGGNGGGVGIFGAGANGTAGGAGAAGGAGSSGSGQLHGAGGRGSDSSTSTNATAGGRGAVRVIWGTGRSYPSTNTANQTTVVYQPFIAPFFGPEVQSVTITDIISFPTGTFVKITDPSINFSTIEEILESSTGRIQFSASQGFPTTLSASARIEGMSPTNYPLSFANTKIRSSTRPYTLLAASDSLAVSQSDPTQQGIKFYNRSIYTDFDTVTRQQQGKLSTVNRVISTESNRNAGTIDKFKIDFDTIAEVEDARSIDVILSQDTSQTAFWRAAGADSGILSLRGINFDIQIKVGADPGLKETAGALTPYNIPGLYDGFTYAAVGQDNVKWTDIEDYYTYDLDVLSVKISPAGDYQTLYYTTNLFYPRKIFNVGDFARIVYEKYDIDQVVEVLNSTLNSITFSTLENFPDDYTGGMTLQLATVFFYPKERVFNEFIKKQYPFENVTLPRENLFVSEYRPIQKNRTVSFFIDRELSGDNNALRDTTKSLELFNTDLTLPPDISIKIVGENTAVKYNTRLWYQDDQDIITFTTEEITQKILFFEDQQTLPFRVGDTVRLHNPDIGYSKLVTVLDSSNRFIAIDIVEDFPGIGNLFIENLTTSVYPQRFVSLYPGEQPKTPRENLFYFEFLPTLRSPSLPISFDTVNSKIDVNFFKDYIQAKSIDISISFNFLEKDSIKILEIKDDRVVSKLSAAVKVVADNVDRNSGLKLENFTSQNTVKPTTNPVSAAEKFYYFNLAPGYRFNNSIQQGAQLFQDSNAQLTENLRSVTPLLSDRSTLSADIINLFKIENFEVIETPSVDNLEKDYIKIISLDNLFSVDRLSAAVKVVDTRIILSTETLRSSTTVRESQVFKDINYVDKFLTRDYADGGTVSADFLTKEIFNLRESARTISADFLTKEIFNLRETIKVDDYGNLSAASVLKESRSADSIGNVRAMTILIPTNTFNIFEKIEAYNNQFDTVISNVFPTSVRENFFYFNLAPGYRSNNSIQQGVLFDTASDKQSFEFLSKFEFQGLTGGPRYQVTNQDQGLTTNTVLYYINDLDILTVTERSVDSITVFFDNTDNTAVPYSIGTFVVITRFDVDTGIEFTYTVEVIDSGFNFIKTPLLEGWNNRWKFTDITTPYADFYPTERVSLTTAPFTPREVLRYSQIAPGYRTNNTLQQGFAFEPDYTFDLSKILSLEKDSIKLFEVFSDTLLNKTFSLEKALLMLNEIYPDSVRFDGRIEISKFGEDFNEFAVVLVPDDKGLVIRLRTDRYQDVAAPKKEPVQFWN